MYTKLKPVVYSAYIINKTNGAGYQNRRQKIRIAVPIPEKK